MTDFKLSPWSAIPYPIAPEMCSCPGTTCPEVINTPVYDELLTLIDNYAETRHQQGYSSYNKKTQLARAAVENKLKSLLTNI